MSIYTRKGDDGFTSHPKYGRISKSSTEIEVEGKFDEAIVTIGFALVELERHSSLSALVEPVLLAQRRLFPAGFGLFDASATDDPIVAADVADLEQSIDEMSALLPPLRSFVIPGGSEASARLHKARVAVRSLERACHVCEEKCGPIEPLVSSYLNRLSDFFFTVARYALHLEGLSEDDVK